jgi:nicotinamidase/pyrazinamidase
LKAAILVIDMLRDSFREEKHLSIAKEGKAIIPNINYLLEKARQRRFPAIFCCDSFLGEDFIFKGRMKPQSIRGTEGARVIDEITKSARDMYLSKRRFSAFYKTDLDQTLRTLDIDTIAVTGIATSFCVLATVFDAISYDFKTVLIEDCSACANRATHSIIVDIYRKSPLFPLLQVMKASDFIRGSEQA